MTNAERIEYNAQARQSGKIIAQPDKPVIGCRPFDPREISSVQDELNARRWSAFHARWARQQEPKLQLWKIQ
ncbi:MAG: hypothetical protein U9Q35_01135 [Pseudomonadota bacterium]|nr:hypothetical protein [Pseudomonadota bacterium]